LSVRTEILNDFVVAADSSQRLRKSPPWSHDKTWLLAPVDFE
jgi:hypothetical protein